MHGCTGKEIVILVSLISTEVGLCINTVSFSLIHAFNQQIKGNFNRFIPVIYACSRGVGLLISEPSQQCLIENNSCISEHTEALQKYSYPSNFTWCHTNFYEFYWDVMRQTNY